MDADVPFNQVLSMPYWVVDDYYTKGAWKMQKEQKEKHDQMQMNILTALGNISAVLKNIPKF